MADLYGLEASGLPPELIAKLQGLKQQQAIAQALLEQSMQAPEPGAVKGRFQGAVHPLEYLAKIVQGQVARGQMGDVDKGRADVASQQAKRVTDALMQVRERLRPTPAQHTLPPDLQGPSIPEKQPDLMSVAFDAMSNPVIASHPMVKSITDVAIKGVDREDQQTFLKAQAEEAHKARLFDRVITLEQRAAESKARSEDRALDREARAQAQRESAAVQRELGLARLEQSRASGSIRDEIAQQRLDILKGKDDDKKAKTQLARQDIDILTTELDGLYNKLDELDGITSTDKPGGTNLIAGIASSAPGQFAGRMFGTEEQSYRNSILQTRPILMGSIKDALNLSAQQLNSNVELMMWINTATDPTLDIQANKRALENLRKLIGTARNERGGGAPQTGGIPKISSDAEFNALPKGAVFIDPDGKKRVKP